MSYHLSRMGMPAIAISLGLWLAVVTLVSMLLPVKSRVAFADNSGMSPGEAGIGLTQGVISPTTNFVLFERPNGLDSTIWLFTDGLTQTRVITGQRPRLSNDGRRMIYLAGNADPIYSDIYVYDFATQISTKVFSNWDSIVYYAWTNDDSRIIYDFRCHIYAMDPDGSNNQQLTEQWPDNGIEYCYNDNPDVNPIDGRLVWENQYHGLAVAGTDGSNPTWITNTQPGDSQPRWSPDGEWIAFFRDSDAEDDDNFFKIRPDGTGLTKLTALTGDDLNEMEYLGGWSADGRFLVGTGERSGAQAIYAISTDGSKLMLPLLEENGADRYFVGSVGNLTIDLSQVYLPLIVRGIVSGRE